MSFYKGNTILVSDQPKIKDRIFTMQYITQVNFCHSEKNIEGAMVGSQLLSNQYLEGHRHQIITNMSSYVL